MVQAVPGQALNGRALNGRVAMVTGGASGMGQATVERFVAEGASVVVGDLNTERGEALVAALTEAGAGDRVRFARTDVAVEDDIASLVSLALDAFGGLDVVFSNAGIGGAFGPITEIEVDDWDATFAVLVRSVFLGTKYAARVMMEAGHGGSIINTASVAGMVGGSGPQAYSAAKAAVINLTVTTALELAPHRIRVNAICPGVIFTPLMHGGREAEAAEAVAGLQPWPDRGEGSDIASMALFLASDESRFVSGQAHVVDGALLAAGTRVFGNLPGTATLHRKVGMAHGTTGRAATVRRLDDGTTIEV
jgi:NAD(P)-dependent dehydrogenase (short-subunit alcohol dehydrogenase family)